MHFKQKFYYVYIMTNRSRTLYTGITGNLPKRAWQHKTGAFPGFTSCYKPDRLVCYEHFNRVGNAITREKQIKRQLRIKKIALIVSMNPEWIDLSATGYDQYKPQNAWIPRPRIRSANPLPQDDSEVERNIRALHPSPLPIPPLMSS